MYCKFFKVLINFLVRNVSPCWFSFYDFLLCQQKERIFCALQNIAQCSLSTYGQKTKKHEPKFYFMDMLFFICVCMCVCAMVIKKE